MSAAGSAPRSPDEVRVILRVHELPGRLRLRLPWLRKAIEEARSLADALARLDPSIDVELRPSTGSLLCRFDPERLDADQIVAAVRRETGVAIVRRAGEIAPALEARMRRTRGARASRFSHATRQAFRDLNQSVLRGSDGTLDLGALAALGFLTLGAAEILSSRRIPAPPWFNLAWWSFRTLTIFSEQDEEADDEGGVGGGGGGGQGGLGDADTDA